MALVVLAFGRPATSPRIGMTASDTPRSGSRPLEPGELPARRGLARRGNERRDAGAAARRAPRPAAVLALAYSPDGLTLASAGDDAVVVLREVATGKVVGRFRATATRSHACRSRPTARPWPREATTGRSSCGTWHPAGQSDAQRAYQLGLLGGLCRRWQSLASAGHDKTVRVWDAVSGRETATLAGHSASVRAVAFAPGRSGDAGLPPAGPIGRDGLGPLRRSPVASLDGHKVRFAPSLSRPMGTLATASEDGEVKLWDVPSGRERARLLGHSDTVTCLAFSPQGAILATGSLDTTVKLWEPATGRERASLHGHTEGLSALAFAPTGGRWPRRV